MDRMDTKRTVLIVDDCPMDRSIYRRSLINEGHNYDIIEAENAEQGLDFAHHQRPDCILVDYNLPDQTGIEFIEELYKHHELKKLPVIMLTGQGYSNLASNAIQSGAHDYLVKSQDSFERLWLSISNVIEKNRLMQQVKDKNEELKKIAYFDPLTKLHNRASFNESIKKAISSAKRHNRLISLLFIDLDNFKNVNDSLGHDIGDTLLKLVAKRIKKTVRLEDYVARFGGDEFAVLLTNMKSTDNSGHVAAKLIEAIQPQYNINNNSIRIGASIGIANFPEAGTDLTTLTKSADIAMYKAKNEGKNTFHYFSEELNRKHQQRLALENALRNAVENKEFHLEYQPKYDVKTQKINGIEALIRWNNPQLGNIPPNQFIPMAEEIGLINSIDYWVLETACKQYASWRQAHNIDFPISVNMSLRQLNNDSLVQRIESVIEANNIPKNKLEIELKKSIFLNDMEIVEQRIHELHELGVLVSIDDFGNGFSSINHLQRLDISTIKISPDFIRKICSHDGSTTVIKSMISLAQELGVNVIAEGVESKQQCDFLIDHNCPQAQGYYFNKPLKENVLDKLLAERSKIQTSES